MPEFMSHLRIQKLVMLKRGNKLSNLKENNDIVFLNCMMFLFNILTNRLHQNWKKIGLH